MDIMKNNFKIIIAGGKTGGHLFPGIAIAQAVLRIKPEAEILFVGAGSSFETRTLARYGFAHRKILSAGIKGKGGIQKIRALLQIPVSIIQAIIIVRRFRPDIVVGVGGFSSGPVVLGARLCNVPTAIQEQNSIAGMTNKILARIVRVIFTSFKDTKGFTQTKKIIHTGNPIRKDEISILQKSDKESLCDGLEKCSSEDILEGRNRKFTLLVTGGSQGAKSINSAFIEAVGLMQDREKYYIIHQTGATDEERVLRAYSDIGIRVQKTAGIVPSELSSDMPGKDSFSISASAFFNDLPKIQAQADLIICRAGAGTISEITAIGKAAILVPYPYAADDHQTYNARTLVDQEAAWMIADSQLSGRFLKDKIEFAANHPEYIFKMAQKAKALGRPMADEIIASTCIKMATT